MTPTPPKEQAIHLLADYATAQSALKAATAEFEAEAIKITAAIAKATAAEKARIEELEEQLKALALKHGAEIFGDKRGMVESGWKLGLTEVEEVEMDGDEQTVCRVILRDLKWVEKKIEAAEAKDDKAAVLALNYERLALSSLLTIKTAINKSYVRDNADASTEWFEQYGIRVIQRESASVKPAPKPRVPKSKKAKAETELEEAA